VKPVSHVPEEPVMSPEPVNQSADVIYLGVPQQPSLSFHTLKDYLLPRLTMLYGKNRAPELADTLFNLVERARQQRPKHLKRQDRLRAGDWYKRIVIYSLYVNAFGAESAERPSTFDDLIGHLNYFKTLGVDTLHLLPFLESPMIDAGFDVSDYERVRDELGGNAAFERFMQAAKQHNLFIMMDMVLNHASEQHPDFQAAIRGDLEKRDRFIHRDSLPEFHADNLPGLGTVIRYCDGSNIRKMLSDFEGSHYNPSYINGQCCYFYSTFMPQQKDWNWLNPAVLLEHVRLLSHWANQGIDIFRLDALPFLVKQPGTNGENTPGTHAVVQILSACLQLIAPSVALLAEAGVAPNELVKYYGEEARIELPDGRSINRCNEVQMTYHFPLMSAIWTTMLSRRAEPVLDILKKTPPIPESAAQITFVRVHDELSMESVQTEWQQIVHDTLAPQGEGCRNGIGIAGRVANFLECNLDRIYLLYSILFSLPGTPLLYYGDDLAALNNPMHMLQEAHKRAARLGHTDGDVFKHIDKRDLNRGPLAAEVLHRALHDAESIEGRMLAALQRMIMLKKSQKPLSRGCLIPLTAQTEDILVYWRRSSKERILIIQNLSDQERDAVIQIKSPASAKRLTARAVRDLLSDQIITVQPGSKSTQVHVQMQPYQALWLKEASR
jgi:maltose alpha-D-glucosyltransferase/alpha-amylase